MRRKSEGPAPGKAAAGKVSERGISDSRCPENNIDILQQAALSIRVLTDGTFKCLYILYWKSVSIMDARVVHRQTSFTK